MLDTQISEILLLFAEPAVAIILALRDDAIEMAAWPTAPA